MKAHVARTLLAGLAAAFLWSPGARAQRPLVQQFAYSTVLLTSGDTLRGPLTYYADRDLLLVQQADRSVRTASAAMVRAFAVRGELTGAGEYLDMPAELPEPRRTPALSSAQGAPLPALLPQRAEPNATRVFRSLRWNHGAEYADYRTPAFFEQLSAGPTLLLRRQQLVERPVSSTDPMFLSAYPAGGLPRGTVGYIVSAQSQFFLATPAGEVLALRNPRRHLLAYFQAEAAQIEEYARQQRLSFNTSDDLARLVSYANALRRQAADAR
ncbi:hypothetical protein LJ737_07100 [Hymenobacter sp. 15J16-1T3B]|uniref:hypothetical protein n=1 Tax=Hymenobacter sp. 15J16-1T3B TaxID=2886941 RepID=UPI001D118853|nr:hypothetical protein [Hymenobacter sp. 15J16-1T3B]MCC3156998.1 hypothetical protein [Hymenobacter sp. 15J16-1T3B]